MVGFRWRCVGNIRREVWNFVDDRVGVRKGGQCERAKFMEVRLGNFSVESEVGGEESIEVREWFGSGFGGFGCGEC